MRKRDLEDLMTDDMRARRELCPHWGKGQFWFGKCRPPEFFNLRMGNPEFLPPEDVKKALIKRQNPKRIWEWLKRDPWFLECVLEPTEDMCLEAVRADGMTLIHVEVQTEGICRAAVKTEPNAIAFCWDQTEELCLMAVRKNGLALSYIQEEARMRRVCLEAVKQNGGALEYVPDELKDSEMCWAAVKRMPIAIVYVPDEIKTPEMEAYADDINTWLELP